MTARATAETSSFRSQSLIMAAVPALVDEQLFPEELACIRGAAEKRRAEFGTARLVARRALSALGFASEPLLPGAGGAPAWPRGATGSISHTDGYCAVIVGPTPPARAFGIDVERVRSLDGRTGRAILTPRERAWLAREPPDSRAALSLLVFSAKEAYYKCQYPLSGAVLAFQEVEIELDRGARTFQATTRSRAVPPEAARLRGHFLLGEAFVLCALELLDREES